MDDSASPPEPGGLGIVFDEVKARLRDQEQRIEALSENARFVLTAASLLVAGFGGLLGLVVRGGSPAGPPALSRFEEWSAFPTIAIYLVVVCYAVQGFKPRGFTASPAPKGLEDYVGASLAKTKEDLFFAMVEAYDRNRARIDAKAICVERAQWALVIEAAWLTVFVVVRAIA